MTLEEKLEALIGNYEQIRVQNEEMRALKEEVRNQNAYLW